MRIAVIGAGLFGCIIARELRERGHDVKIFSESKPEAGSLPAACLIKPSWISSIKTDQRNAAMELLKRNYNLKEIGFRIGMFKNIVYWVDPEEILEEGLMSQDSKNAVRAIDLSGKITFRDRDPSSENDYDMVVVAAGVWCNEILPISHAVPGLAGRAGVIFLFDGQLPEAFIKPWAPYKQIVGFNINRDTIWISDGTSILRENLTTERIEKSLQRCINALPDDYQYRDFRIGIRPYVPSAKPCYLNRISEKVWVATGGAKNGTVAAAWSAQVIGDELVGIEKSYS